MNTKQKTTGKLAATGSRIPAIAKQTMKTTTQTKTVAVTKTTAQASSSGVANVTLKPTKPQAPIKVRQTKSSLLRMEKLNPKTELSKMTTEELKKYAQSMKVQNDAKSKTSAIPKKNDAVINGPKTTTVNTALNGIPHSHYNSTKAMKKNDEEKQQKEPVKKVARPNLRRSISEVYRKKLGINEAQNCIKPASARRPLPKSCLKKSNSESSFVAPNVSFAVQSPIAETSFARTPLQSLDMSISGRPKKSVKFDASIVSNNSTPVSLSTNPLELKARLEQWLLKRGKPLQSYQHLRCFQMRQSTPFAPMSLPKHTSHVALDQSLSGAVQKVNKRRTINFGAIILPTNEAATNIQNSDISTTQENAPIQNDELPRDKHSVIDNQETTFKPQGFNRRRTMIASDFVQNEPSDFKDVNTSSPRKERSPIRDDLLNTTITLETTAISDDNSFTYNNKNTPKILRSEAIDFDDSVENKENIELAENVTTNIYEDGGYKITRFTDTLIPIVDQPTPVRSTSASTSENDLYATPMILAEDDLENTPAPKVIIENYEEKSGHNSEEKSAHNSEELANKCLEEILQACKDGLPHDLASAYLKALQEKHPQLTKSPLYWECRANIEDFNTALDCYQNAIIQGGDIEKIEKSVEQLLHNFSLMSINTPDQLRKKEEIKKRNRDMIGAFKTTVIRLAVTKRDDKAKKTVKNDDYVMTPVRRSTRLSKSGYLTPNVDLYKSMSEVTPKQLKNIKFQTNAALL